MQCRPLSMAQSNCKWITVYQDHITTKRAAEVAFQLADIFLLQPSFRVTMGLSSHHYSVKGSVVHGKPRHPQSQGSVEHANGDIIKDMLVAWLADNNMSDWTVVIKFLQFQKNSAHHSGINCSPYSAMFGCEAQTVNYFLFLIHRNDSCTAQ